MAHRYQKVLCSDALQMNLQISSNTSEQYRDFPLNEGQCTRLSAYVLRLTEPHIAEYITRKSDKDLFIRGGMPKSNDMYYNAGSGGRSTSPSSRQCFRSIDLHSYSVG